MKTLCIVPFTSKEFPLLPHLMSSYDNVIFLSPKGIGTDKEDIAMMQNLEPLGFKFCNSIKGSIEIADDVLVSNINVEDVALYNFAYDALECAVKKGKKVMSFLQMHSYQKELLKKRSKINIDLKVNNDKELISKLVVKLIEKYNMEEEVIITSSNYGALLDVISYDSNIKIGYITKSLTDDFNVGEIDVISIAYEGLNKEVVQRVHGFGKQIFVWTVNDEEKGKRAISLGVDNIITDDVVMIKNLINKISSNVGDI